MYRKPNIVTATKVRRLECAGHLVRMPDDTNVNNVFMGKPDGRRKAERPKLRWLDCAENDLESMDVKRWRKKAEGRSVRAIIVKEALVKLQGPHVNEEEEKNSFSQNRAIYEVITKNTT
jgi:hypothetical protein